MFSSLLKPVVCGYVALPFAVNRAVFKDRRRGSKDEIDVAFDVAVFEVVATAVNKQRILPAEKATILKRSALGIDKQRHRL